MIDHLKTFLVLLCFTFLYACGGGSGDTGDEESNNFDGRVDVTDIPAEYEGARSQNARMYEVEEGAFKTSVLVSGLDGVLTLSLDDEIATINSNGKHLFQATYSSNQSVTLNIDTQPESQDCFFVGGINSGYTQPNAELEFYINCQTSNSPSAPFIDKIYSATTDSFSIEWKDSIDINDDKQNLVYIIYWSELKEQVEDLSADSLITNAGSLSLTISNLSANTDYYVAIRAQDPDGNKSRLSYIGKIKTIKQENEWTGVPYFLLDRDSISVTETEWIAPISLFSSLPNPGNILIANNIDSAEYAKVISISSVGSNYEIQVSQADLSDLFNKLSLSSDVGLDIIGSAITAQTITTQKSTINAYSNAASVVVGDIVFSDEYLGIKYSPVPGPLGLVCRAATIKGDIEIFEDISFEPFQNEYEPRAINQLEFNFTTAPYLSGFYAFQGSISIGGKIHFQNKKKVSGSITCDIKNLPAVIKRTIIPVPIGPYVIPVPQTVETDLQLKFSFDAKAEASIETQVVATSTLDVFYSADTNQFQIDPIEPSYWPEAEIKTATNLDARLSIVPKLLTVIAGTGKLFVKSDVGVDVNLDASNTGENDVIAKFRTTPYVIDSFSISTNTKHLVGAEFSIGRFGIKSPEATIYTTDAKRIFDSPKICINRVDANTSSLCKTEKQRKNGFPKEKEYELEVHLLDGENNKYDLNSIQWYVTPDNGYLEVNKDDPRKAVFKPGDNKGYTIVASHHGKLGDIARKYVEFSFTDDECNFGLGNRISGKYYVNDQMGFFFPPGKDTEEDSEVDYTMAYHETCEIIDNYQGLIASYFGGVLNGKFRYYPTKPLYSDDGKVIGREIDKDTRFPQYVMFKNGLPVKVERWALSSNGQPFVSEVRAYEHVPLPESIRVEDGYRVGLYKVMSLINTKYYYSPDQLEDEHIEPVLSYEIKGNDAKYLTTYYENGNIKSYTVDDCHIYDSITVDQNIRSQFNSFISGSLQPERVGGAGVIPGNVSFFPIFDKPKKKDPGKLCFRNTRNYYEKSGLLKNEYKYGHKFNDSGRLSIGDLESGKSCFWSTENREGWETTFSDDDGDGIQQTIDEPYPAEAYPDYHYECRDY